MQISPLVDWHLVVVVGLECLHDSEGIPGEVHFAPGRFNQASHVIMGTDETKNSPWPSRGWAWG